MAEGKKILIAEDEKPIAEALKLKLEHEGYTADIAEDGEEAFSKVKDGYSLVILDLVMPKVDGFEFLKKCKEANIKTPIIVASNLSQDEDIKRAKELGAKDFYIKSNVSLAEIVTKIKSVA
jgi:DNA-binding response OmpR family regulator